MTTAAPLTIAEVRRRLWELAHGNLAAIFTAQVVSGLASLAVMVMINRVYARPGDTADAGRLAAINSIVMTVILLTAVGVAQSVTLRISRARAAGGEGESAEIARSVGAGLILGGGIGAVLLVLGVVVPLVVLWAARIGWPAWAATIEGHVAALQLAALWFPSWSMIVVMVAVFDGFQRMRWSLLAEGITFQSLRLGAAALVMLVAGWAWMGLIGAWAVASAVAALLIGLQLWIFLKRRKQPVARTGLPLGGIGRDWFFMFLPTAASPVTTQAGVLVAWAAGGDAASATFWVTWSLALLVTALCGPVGRVLFPAVANLRASSDKTEMARVLRRAFWGVSAVGLLFVLIVNASKGLVLVYLHQEGQGAVFTVLLAAGFFEISRMLFNPVLLASGMERPLTVVEWISLAAIVLAGYPAVVAWGVIGLAGVFVAVLLVGPLVRVALVARATGVGLWRETLVTTAVVLAVMTMLLMCDLGRL